jgi:UDP-N-acetylmuramoyl-L-alanyl-D-glutamate--2,6-diaminopimelate ligase
MGKAAAELADIAVFTAEDPRRESLDAIMAEMERGATSAQPMRAKILKIGDRGEAIRSACALAQTGDTVVACGKGHEQSLCYGVTEYAWDDREAMRRAIRGEKLGLCTTLSQFAIPATDG